METDVSNRTVATTSPEDTGALGRALAGVLRAGDVVILSGTLGAGKTCFVNGLAKGLDVAGHVSSPTFTILHTHDAARAGGLRLHHLDVYRLRDESDFLSLGFGEILSDNAVTVIEWGDRVRGALPDDAIELRFSGALSDEGSFDDLRVIACTVAKKDAGRILAAFDEWEGDRSGG